MNSPSTRRSFLDLTKDHNIVIPHLQRDYAQGRKSENEKLSRFIAFLKDALDKSNAINLDFVFGYYEGTELTKSFIPIDGQQRLTTVFLLHWYLAKRSGNYTRFENFISQNGRVRFTYQTRISSQEFISSLVSEAFNVHELENSDNNVSILIENCGWFYKPWREDSTVEAMLNALDTIHSSFKETPNIESYYSKLEKGLISFEFLDPDAIQLSDEFYIKMNARGLPLTSFENFKADLLGTLSDHFSHYKNEFAQKLDGSWSDCIWNWSQKSQNTYDATFRNVFDFLFQICYSKQKSSELASSYNLSSHYAELLDQSNIEFISATLDLFELLDKHCSTFELENDELLRLCLNLFSSKNLGHHDKIKLYGVIQYKLKYGLESHKQSAFDDFIRVVENVLQNTNQSKKREFASDLRTSRYKELIEFIDQLLAYQDPYKSLSIMKDQNLVITHEIKKAKLVQANPDIKQQLQRFEDHEYLKGCLKNFMFLFETPSSLKQNVDLFYTLWNPEQENDFALYQALFSLGDPEVDVGGSGLGRVYYVGKKGKWHRVLANTNKESVDQIKVFRKLFEHLDGTNLGNAFSKLREIPLPSITGWRYYLARYPEVLKDFNLFAFSYKEELITRLELLKGTMLSADHTGYLNRAVMLELEKQNISTIEKLGWIANGVVWSTLKIGEAKIEFTGEQWKIYSPSKLSIDDEFTLTPIDGKPGEFMLSSSTEDLVQQMVLFIKKYFTKEVVRLENN